MEDLSVIMKNQYPSREVAEKELHLAGRLNPGPWVNHSLNTGLAAMYLAQKCDNLDPEKAYVLGVLHDIGRRVGIVTQRHIIEGYKYCMNNEWEEVARVCMTHSFMIQKNPYLHSGYKSSLNTLI